LLLYIHGFESSPKSIKILQLNEYIQQSPSSSRIKWLAPQIPPSMQAAKALFDQMIIKHQISAVMGSSLGGFWTHYVVSRLHSQGQRCRGVLVNPAIKPYQWMPQTTVERVHPYTNERYRLGPEDRNVLVEAEQQFSIVPELLVLLQKGDETLDYREAKYYYQHQRMIIENGGDHSFNNFPRYLPAALEFLHAL
jgi:uncharacterized protein